MPKIKTEDRKKADRAIAAAEMQDVLDGYIAEEKERLLKCCVDNPLSDIAEAKAEYKAALRLKAYLTKTINGGKIADNRIMKAMEE